MPQTAISFDSQKFADAFPSTITDDNMLIRRRDNPRIQVIKELSSLLLERISTREMEATVESLRVELGEILILFSDIFADGKPEELNALRIVMRQKMNFQGKARLLKFITDHKETSDETKYKIKKFILDETR